MGVLHAEESPQDAAELLEADPHAPEPLERPELVYEITIEARYEPETRDLSGTQRLRWRNTTQTSTDELYFHLYLNAFANNRSAFIVESDGGQLRGDRFDGEHWGFIEVTRLELQPGPASGQPGPIDLKAAERVITPPSSQPGDRTVVAYPLPQSLGPGETVDLEISFSGRLPRVFARTGAVEDFVLGGQWFPKIGVFEAAGMRGRQEAGWNCLPYHAFSEYYADFGTYDVTLDLPEQYLGKVGASGRKVEEKVAEGRVRTRFVTEEVVDFAWGAWPSFEVHTTRFDPATDVPQELRQEVAEELGVDAASLELRPVDISLFIGPARRGLVERYLHAAKASLASLGLRYGAFPYSSLTMVDPPHSADGSAGMEYPTFVTLGGTYLFTMPFFDRIQLPEVVTAHEIAHQYFQSTVASNEAEEAFLDEGMANYAESQVLGDTYGPFHMGAVRFTPGDVVLRPVAGGGYLQPIASPSWTFSSFDAFGTASYARMSATIRHLEGIVGKETVARGLLDYTERWSFRHPAVADFEAALERAAGQDLSWYFDQALHSVRELDFAITVAKTEKLEEPRGMEWQGGGWQTPEAETDSGDGEEASTIYRSEVRVERLGEFIQPVTVELTFEDGETIRQQWDGKARWHEIELRRSSPLVSAAVDPDGVMALDINYLNNGMRVESQSEGSGRLAISATFWLQWLVSSLGGILP
ncbi:MAG: M1 family metallopeptidase [Acidobacteriota bacterium]